MNVKRKQKDVAKENEFYFQLLQQALPIEQQAVTMQQLQSQTQLVSTPSEQHTKSQPHRPNAQYNTSPEKSKGRGNSSCVETSIQNGGIHNSTQNAASQVQNATAKNSHRKSLDKGSHPQQEDQHNKHNSGSVTQIDKSDKRFMHINGTTVPHNDLQFIERISSVNDFDINEVEKDKSVKGGGSGHTFIKTQSNGSAPGKWNNIKESRDLSATVNGQRERKGRQTKITIDTIVDQQKQQDEYCQRLETDIKRLKSDLQSSRQLEQELRSQINTLVSGERQAKADIQQLQHDNDQLQSKLHGFVTARQLDKQTMSSLERRIADERRQRTACEASLMSERRARRAAEEARSAIPPSPPLVRQECTDVCKSRKTQMEQDLRNLRRELKTKEERCIALEKDATSCKDSHGESEILLGALNALQDKNAHLENSLSAETRIKLDLFSALGEAKRQLEIRESLIRSRDKEIEVLKAKIAQDLAVMPQDTFGPAPVSSSTSKLRLNNEVCVGGTKIRANESLGPGCTVSNLDPNATAYTPKGTLVTSTEA